MVQWSRKDLLGVIGDIGGGFSGWWYRDGGRRGTGGQWEGVFAAHGGALGWQDTLVHWVKLRVQWVSRPILDR